MGVPYDLGNVTIVADTIEIGNTRQGTAGSKPGIRSGSGAPTATAPKGTLYIRTDGSSTATRLYVNTDGATTWTNFTSAA